MMRWQLQNTSTNAFFTSGATGFRNSHSARKPCATRRGSSWIRSRTPIQGSSEKVCFFRAFFGMYSPTAEHWLPSTSM
eukprot:scaffold2730_cov247-Pinguiococcus_pyrenoidosus.AAC.17